MTRRKIDDYFFKLKPKNPQKVNNSMTDEKIPENFNIQPSTDIIQRPQLQHQSNIKHEPNVSFKINLPKEEPKSDVFKEEFQENQYNLEENSIYQNFETISQKSDQMRNNSNKNTKNVDEKFKTFKNFNKSSKKSNKISEIIAKTATQVTKEANNSSKICGKCGKSHSIGWAFKVHPCIPKCEFCGQLFRHRLSREFHMRLVHKVSCFICDFCGTNFETKKKMKQHIENVHLKTQNGMFVCDLDGKQWKCKRHLRTHMKNHQVHIKCKICDSKVKPFLLNAHIRNVHSNDRKYSCKICNKAFKTGSTLNHHEKIHNKKFECKYCGWKFADNWFLNQHIQANHENPRQFQCEICKMKLNLEYIHRKHLLTHDKSAPKPHKCSRCGFSFRTKTSLKSHQKYHARKDAKIANFKTPFKCKLCPAILKNYKILLAHVRNVHKKESQFYSCDLCGKQIKLKPNILVHFKGVHKIQ